MTKKEAVSLVRESAKFWQSETLRFEGSDGLRPQTSKNIDGITSADPDCYAALFVLGESEFLKEFNGVYMAE